MKLRLGSILIITQIVFLILKWTNIINWNLVIVLLPLIIIGVIILLIIITAIIEVSIKMKRRK